MLCDCGVTTRSTSERVPVLEQMGKVAGHQKWVNHIIPAEVLHDGLDWVGLKVLGGGARQIKGKQGKS